MVLVLLCSSSVFFSIILLRKRELFALLLAGCHVDVCVLCLFHTVKWVGHWSVIVVFPGHTHLLVLILFLYTYMYIDIHK